MTSEQQVILFLSLVGVFWMAVGAWLNYDLKRTERAEAAQKATKAHPAE